MSIAIARKVFIRNENEFFPEMTGVVVRDPSNDDKYRIISYQEATQNHEDQTQLINEINNTTDPNGRYDYIFYRTRNNEINSFYKRKQYTWYEFLVERDGFEFI